MTIFDRRFSQAQIKEKENAELEEELEQVQNSVAEKEQTLIDLNNKIEQLQVGYHSLSGLLYTNSQFR